MKKLAGMYYGRLESYAGALDRNDREALEAALKRNIEQVLRLVIRAIDIVSHGCVPPMPDGRPP